MQLLIYSKALTCNLSILLLMSKITAGEPEGYLRKGYFVIIVRPKLSKFSLVGYRLYASTDPAMRPTKPFLAAVVNCFDKRALSTMVLKCAEREYGSGSGIESSGIF